VKNQGARVIRRDARLATWSPCIWDHLGLQDPVSVGQWDGTKPRYGDLLENHSGEDWVCPNLSQPWAPVNRQPIGFVHLEDDGLN